MEITVNNSKELAEIVNQTDDNKVFVVKLEKQEEDENESSGERPRS